MHHLPRALVALLAAVLAKPVIGFGAAGPVTAEDSCGKPTDFSKSPKLQGTRDLPLTAQGAHDTTLGTAHLGIWNSPATWAATWDFLSSRHGHGQGR